MQKLASLSEKCLAIYISFGLVDCTDHRYQKDNHFLFSRCRERMCDQLAALLDCSEICCLCALYLQMQLQPIKTLDIFVIFLIEYAQYCLILYFIPRTKTNCDAGGPKALKVANARFEISACIGYNILFIELFFLVLFYSITHLDVLSKNKNSNGL